MAEQNNTNVDKVTQASPEKKAETPDKDVDIDRFTREVESGIKTAESLREDQVTEKPGEVPTEQVPVPTKEKKLAPVIKVNFPRAAAEVVEKTRKDMCKANIKLSDARDAFREEEDRKRARLQKKKIA